MTESWQMLKWSISLDYIFLFRVEGVPFSQKLIFVFLKYLIFIKNKTFGWTVGVTSVVIFGERFYYNEVFGIASLQRVYCEHYSLREILPPGALIVDVGANIGQFNFFSRHYLQASRVISVEPLEGSFAILALNTDKPGDCYRCALSDRNGVKKMYVPQRSSSLSSYIPESGSASDASCEVESRTLDHFFATLGISHIDLLKIDTEGSECDVIRGGVSTLVKCAFVTIEMSAFRASSGNLFLTGKLIEEAGFRLLALSHCAGDQPAAVDGLFVRLNESRA